MTAASEVRAGSAAAPDGTPLAYRRWYGERTGTPLVLVHGTSAHAGWWDHVVPLLPDRFDVVAVDLAGHGDSGRRPEYALDSWSGDVLAVAHELFPGEAAVLVGHSVGGLVAAGAAVLDPAAAAATVLVDSIVTDPPPGAVPDWRPPRADRVFASREEVVGRFRLTPPQPEADPDVLRAIALASVRPLGGGWAWKVDAHIFAAVGRSGMGGRLAELPGPVAVVRGERSVLVGPSAGADLAALVGHPVPQFDVPGAHHHLMIDHPTELGEHLALALDAVSPARSAQEVRP